MRKTSVLIVEDEALQRRGLERELRASGFEVVSAASADEARAKVEERREPFDVVVLDMHLKGDDVTGAQLGAEFLERASWRYRPPEFLINSAFSWSEYFEQALSLGVAAYLNKDQEAGVHDVVRHVRVLALRRALSLEAADVVERIRSFAIISCDQTEAIRRFCTEFICGELRESLGHSFLVLLTTDSGTVCISDRSTLPDDSGAYSLLQALTFGETGRSGPFEFNFVDELMSRRALSDKEVHILRSLDGSAFVPLAAERDVRLSVGLLPAAKGEDSLREARQLAELLGRFFSPAVLDGLLKVLTAFSELEQRRVEVARATSQFCLYVGQEQLAALDAAEDSGELASRGPYLEKLTDLAEDLTRSGILLGDLVKKKSGQDVPTSEQQNAELRMSQIIRDAWEQRRRMLREEEHDIFQLDDSDCVVHGSKEYLRLAVTVVLEWFIQRVIETPAGEKPGITVRCEAPEEGPRVVFTDRSRKLPPALRQHLFVPLARVASSQTATSEFKGPGLHLSLYLAKMLVELGNGGLLLDESDASDSSGEVGHKLVMRFPQVRPQLAA